MQNHNAVMRRAGRVLSGLTLVAAAGVASAAGTIAAPDTSAITDALTGVGIVGLAVFGVYVAVKGYGWLRRVL